MSASGDPRHTRDGGATHLEVLKPTAIPLQQGPHHGEETNLCEEAEKDQATQQSKSPRPKTQMHNINRRTQEARTTHPKSKSRSSLSKDLAGGRAISLHTRWETGRPKPVGAWEVKGRWNVGGDRTVWMNVRIVRVHAQPMRPPLLCRAQGPGRQPARLQASRQALF